MGQCDDRPVVASLLVAALFVASAASCGSLDATEVAATLSGLIQPGDDIAGHRHFAGGPCPLAVKVAAVAAQVWCPHAFRGMLHPMQLRAFSGLSRMCA